MFLFLHGFGGFPDDFKAIADELKQPFVSLSIPGHANTPSLTQAGITSIQDLVKYLLRQYIPDEPYYLCGYSMGGRLALLLAEELQPKGLVLFSTGLGLENENAINQRKIWQQKLASILTTDPVLFWRQWYDQPLFCSIKRHVGFSEMIERKLTHNNIELAKAFSCFSALSHEQLRGTITRTNNVLYIVGNRDKKYVKIARELQRANQATVAYVPEASHSVLFEAPKSSAEILRQWMYWQQRREGNGEKYYS